MLDTAPYAACTMISPGLHTCKGAWAESRTLPSALAFPKEMAVLCRKRTGPSPFHLPPCLRLEGMKRLNPEGSPWVVPTPTKSCPGSGADYSKFLIKAKWSWPTNYCVLSSWRHLGEMLIFVSLIHSTLLRPAPQLCCLLRRQQAEDSSHPSNPKVTPGHSIGVGEG